MLKKEWELDFCIANSENAAGGFGVTKEIAVKIFCQGIDVQTSGNHIWDKKEILTYLDSEQRFLRPANYPEGNPGFGSGVLTAKNGLKIAVANLMGRTFMADIDCPFRKVEVMLPRLREETNIVIIDFHAEATSEKQAFGWFLDGRVSAVIGTHTHVQTADEKILPGGTAYITDCGMTGAHESVIGIRKEDALQRFLTGIPNRFGVAERDVRLQGVLLEIDEQTGLATKIERVNLKAGDTVVGGIEEE